TRTGFPDAGCGDDMTTRIAIAAILFAAFIGIPHNATAAPIGCTVSAAASVNVLPAGCAAVLTNGPITFTAVHSSDGHSHNFEIDVLQLFGMNIAANSAEVIMQGVDTDVTAGTQSSFNYFLPNITFETFPDDTSYAPDTGAHTFGVAHFINAFPGGLFKLNFGEAFRPEQSGLESVTSRADTIGPGLITVASTFDLYTELSLDGGFNGGTYRVANNDFIGNTDSPGPGSILQLQAVPEPASLILLGTGLAAMVRRRRST